MTLVLGSVLLSLVNLASAALIAEHRRAGWLLALAAQIPWVWYDFTTGQVGFLLLTLVYVPVYLRGWRKEHLDTRSAQGTTGEPVQVVRARPRRRPCCAQPASHGPAPTARHRQHPHPRQFHAYPVTGSSVGVATVTRGTPRPGAPSVGASRAVA